MRHWVEVVHSVAAKTCQPRLPHQAAPPQTGSSPGPGCQSPHSSPEACHLGRPNKEPEIPAACLGLPVPPTDSASTMSGVMVDLLAHQDYFWSSSLNSFLPHSYALTQTNLFGNSREFHNMESLIISGSTLVNVDDHWCSSFAAENRLEELGELTLSERNVAALHSDGTKQKEETRTLTLQKHLNRQEPLLPCFQLRAITCTTF